MSTPVIAFFSVKGGVGKSTLAFHLSWMFSELGFRTLAVDLDPQSGLTGFFLGTDKAAELSAHGQTIYGGFHSQEVFTYEFDETLSLIPGDVSLMDLEPFLSHAWDDCLAGNARAAGAVTRFHRILQDTARRHSSDLIIMDLSPTAGSINRAALLAANHLIIPVVPDALSVSGLHMAGRVLERWSQDWSLLSACHDASLPESPTTGPLPLGYILLRVRTFQGMPIRTMQRWMGEIPATFHRELLKERGAAPRSPSEDPRCLAMLKESHLLSMAAEATKPVFHLRPADGALGVYMSAVQQEREAYRALANTIAARIGLPAPK